MRLDVYLTENNLTDSRTRAKNLIVLHNVSVNGKITDKVSYEVKEGDNVEIITNYDASLGGLKLRGAIETFSIDIADKDCLDIGASNGGFCDVLLEKGAKRIIALDVAECALPDKLRLNDKIFIKDRTNAKKLKKVDLPFLPELISVDVSFISLTQVLPSIYDCLKDNGKAICLIKPQFECGRKALSKKGIVTNEKEIQKAIDNITRFAVQLGFTVLGTCPAPHPFDNKNQEYFIYLFKYIA